jgi:ABC-type transport system involved in multi-copper enzyme maturation permease subunit
MSARVSRIPGTATIIGTIAALTVRRLVRGRAVWISVAIALLPVAFSALMHERHRITRPLTDLFVIEELLLAVLPAMFVASSIGEEIEDRTTTYLWSRPIGRWAILAGKLVALVPIASALIVAGWIGAVEVQFHHLPDAASVAGIVAGTLVLSLIAAGMATLVPKHGMALTIAYVLFFDFPIGALPASIRQLSVSHHLRVLSLDLTGDDSRTVAAIGITAIACVWAAIALWRIRRREA